MKIQLLIATGDNDYTEHLSGVLSEKHAETFEVSVCSTEERLREMLRARSFDVGLLEPRMSAGVDPGSIRLPLLLWEENAAVGGSAGGYKTIRKYQRVSDISGVILEHYAGIAARAGDSPSAKAFITAVWSPAGGVGKTTVALAYATRMAANGKRAFYLDLEHFSSTMAYFGDGGRSISALFEKLDGNIEMLIRSAQQKDSGTGITYFNRPNNYDDMNILTGQDIAALLGACAGCADELIVDMPCLCDDRMRIVLEAADKIFLVMDSSPTAQVKIRQFMTQHNVFERIRPKTVFVANKGAKLAMADTEGTICLPHVPSHDAASVFQTLSGSSFAG